MTSNARPVSPPPYAKHQAQFTGMLTSRQLLRLFIILALIFPSLSYTLRASDLARAPSPAPTPNAKQEEARLARISFMLQRAEEFRKAGETARDPIEAAEAKRQEAMSLLRAASAGNTSSDARIIQLVSVVRAEQSLSPRARAEVAATSDNLAIHRRRDLDRTQRLRAYEQIARALVSEFPSVSEVYESWMRIAWDSDPITAISVATELLSLPAPEHVKAEARQFLERNGLLGISAISIITPWPAVRDALEKAAGKTVIIFSWASWSPGSVEMAIRMAAKSDSNTVFVGINLDTDQMKAQQLARDRLIPGTSFYDDAGRNGSLARRLAIQSPGLAYTVSPEGIFTSVSAAKELLRPRSIQNP